MITANLGRVQPIYRGIYDNAFSYRPLDFVVEGGLTYYCVADTVGNAPPNASFWVAIFDGADFAQVANNLSDLSDIPDARTNLGLVPTTSDTDTTAGRLLTTGAGPAQAFRRGNILGTVSQSGGVPTGAVIQRGSNSNGEFVRFADGMQICVYRELVGDVTDGTGGGFRSPVQYWTYPATFASDDKLNLGGGVQSTTGRFVSFDLPSTTSTGYRVFGLSSSAVATSARLVAIGRWF